MLVHRENIPRLDAACSCRGFETLTYMLDGKFTHKDNQGNEGTIRSGGVQWMTAGIFPFTFSSSFPCFFFLSLVAPIKNLSLFSFPMDRHSGIGISIVLLFFSSNPFFLLSYFLLYFFDTYFQVKGSFIVKCLVRMV